MCTRFRIRRREATGLAESRRSDGKKAAENFRKRAEESLRDCDPAPEWTAVPTDIAGCMCYTTIDPFT